MQFTFGKTFYDGLEPSNRGTLFRSIKEFLDFWSANFTRRLP